MREEFPKYLASYNSNYVPVRSAFNGFAIYKYDKVINNLYSDIINKSRYDKEKIKKIEIINKTKIINETYNDCEHREFNLMGNIELKVYKGSVFKKVLDGKERRGPC